MTIHSEKSPRIIKIRMFDTYLKVSAITDGAEQSIRHGLELLERHWNDNSDRSFRVYMDDLNEHIQDDAAHIIGTHVLSPEDVYDVITILLRVAVRYVPSALDEVAP